MRIKIKNLAPYFITVLAIIAPWFFHRGYLFFVDFVWGPQIKLIWSDNWFVIKIIFKIVGLIFPADFVEKIFIGSILLLVLFGARKIIIEILNIFNDGEAKGMGDTSVFIVSLFALFNPFIYDRLMYGQVGVVISFGFFLLAAGYLLSFLKTQMKYDEIRFGIFAGMTVMFSQHSVFFLGLIFISLLIPKALNKEIDKQKIKHLLVSTVVIAIALNINWLIGLEDLKIIHFVKNGITRQDLEVFQTTGKDGLEALTNVLMMSGFWGKDQFRYDDLTKFNESWGRSFFLLVPIILLGVFISIKKSEFRKPATALLICFSIAVILAVGIRLPIFSGITYWLFDHLPLYKGIRETQKWVGVIVLIYLVFLSVGVQRLIKIKIVQENITIFNILMGGVIIMQASFLLFGFNGQIDPKSYPIDWATSNQYIVKDGNCKKNILFLPWHMYMSFRWANRVIANPAGNYFACPVFTSTAMEMKGIRDNSASSQGEQIQDFLDKGGNKVSILKDLNIGYIILAKEVDWQKYQWIGNLSILELVQNSDNLVVFKVK